LSAWIRRQRASGVAPTTLLTRELPRMLARKGSNAVLQPINRCATALRHHAYRDRVRAGLAQATTAPHVVVVVPRILHYVIPCLALAVRHVSVTLVLNGTRPWEDEILARRFPHLPTIRLSPVKGSLLPHGTVLDIVLRHAQRNLVLLDPDLFVFDPAVFARLEPAAGEIAVGAFGVTNRAAARTFPTTHLLALDVPAVQALMTRHRIRPVIYRRTPRHLVEPLGKLGFGDHNFVKEYLRCYDPLNLVLAMAVHDGFETRVLNADEEGVVHVGGVSYLERNVVLDYFNLKLLELPFARPFAERYRPLLVGSRSAEQLRADTPATHVLDSIDRTIDRLTDALAQGA
jgi:hypothetical protein